MRFHKDLAFGFLAVACIALSIASLASHTQATKIESSNGIVSARSNFILPKIFDYEGFKQLFKKSYRSLVENLVRKRIFLARAFRVFISAVAYKHWKTNSYLAINQMSDWTPEELRMTKMKPEALGQLHETKVSKSSIPVADLDDIEQKLNEIKQHPNEPGFKELARELDGAQRKRREISPRELSLDNLVREPASTISEPTASVASNNPAYIEPEFMSFGYRNHREQESLSERQVSLIESLPGGQFLSSVMESAAASFSQAAGDLRPANELKSESNNGSLPDEVFIDHRTSNCFLQPRSQGGCGACYSFAAIALYEWHYCMATGQKAAFSEQYVIDCGDRIGLHGCVGGKFPLVSDFVQKFGLELRQHYPFHEKQDQCPYDIDTPDNALGYLRVHDNGFETVHISILESQLKHTPMVMNTLLNENFYEYGGGVDDAKNCDKTDLHSMLLVGSGREDGVEYWLLRNSHSVSWGEKGYYKLNKGSHNCISPRYGFRLKNFTMPQTADMKEISPQIRKRYNEYLELDLIENKKQPKDS